MERKSQIHRVLPTCSLLSLSDQRTVFTFGVTTPYLRGLVMEAIAKFDMATAARYRSILRRAAICGSEEHWFTQKGRFQTRDLRLKPIFLVCLYSAERVNAPSCSTAKSAKSPKLKKSKFSKSAADDQAGHRLQPLGQEKLTVID